MIKITSNKLRFLAYCGLYCPKCYKMKIVNSAQKQLEWLKSTKNNNLALKEKLIKLIDSKCNKFCREGGEQSATCLIKLCCIKHKINGCWECKNIDSCKKLKPQFIENNRKLEKLGIDNFIKQYK